MLTLSLVCSFVAVWFIKAIVVLVVLWVKAIVVLVVLWVLLDFFFFAVLRLKPWHDVNCSICDPPAPKRVFLRPRPKRKRKQMKNVSVTIHHYPDKDGKPLPGVLIGRLIGENLRRAKV